MGSAEEYKSRIIEYMMRYGRAEWSNLLALGIPKASLSRVLRTLLSSGMVKKENRFYVLTDKAFSAIASDPIFPFKLFLTSNIKYGKDVGEVKEIYWIGPRKVVRVSHTAMVVLGKEFLRLKGKKVMLLVQVLEEEEKGRA